MAENLILACYLLFSGCIVVALLNVYWQELLHLPHFVYDCIRGWFKIDTPAEREWSLIKASAISALFIAGYLWWLNTHMAFVSQFPGTLVITVIAIPVAWILWIWRNQDKRENLNNEKVKIEQTEKELGWKEDDRLWNNFAKFQRMAMGRDNESEGEKATAIHALKAYYMMPPFEKKSRDFISLTHYFLKNYLDDFYEKNLKPKLKHSYLDFYTKRSSFPLNIAAAIDLIELRMSSFQEIPPSCNLDMTNFFLRTIQYPVVNNHVKYNFSESDLSFSRFNHANLSECEFDGCNLHDAEFNDVIIDYAQFSYANLSGIAISPKSAREVDFKGANFTGATLEGKFIECCFERTNLSNTGILSGVEFHNCLFEEVILINTLIATLDCDFKDAIVLFLPDSFIIEFKIFICEIDETRMTIEDQAPLIYIKLHYLCRKSGRERRALDNNSNIIDLYQYYKTAMKAKEQVPPGEIDPLWPPIVQTQRIQDQLPYLQELVEAAYYYDCVNQNFEDTISKLVEAIRRNRRDKYSSSPTKQR